LYLTIQSVLLWQDDDWSLIKKLLVLLYTTIEVPRVDTENLKKRFSVIRTE